MMLNQEQMNTAGLIFSGFIAAVFTASMMGSLVCFVQKPIMIQRGVSCIVIVILSFIILHLLSNP